jgi:hypothetical protein
VVEGVLQVHLLALPPEPNLLERAHRVPHARLGPLLPVLVRREVRRHQRQRAVVQPAGQPHRRLVGQVAHADAVCVCVCVVNLR